MFSINTIIFFVIFLPCYPEKLQKKPWEFSPDTLNIMLLSMNIKGYINEFSPLSPYIPTGLGGTSLRSKWSLCIINSLKGCVC